MRVVPRYVVNEPSSAASYTTFEPSELANQYFDNLPDEADEAQRHRNYFTMIYSTDGCLLVGRDALIRDEDDDEDQVGDRTGLRVGVGPPHANPETTQYHTRSGTPANISPGTELRIGFLVTDDNNVAINFSSVDGLLVYDDSLCRSVATEQKRDFLLRTAQPLYVSRWTGVVIRGPVGETQRP